MLNLVRLQVLCAVVERGSFSAAAQDLSYTQSAVSQAIARLEAEIGAPLLVRSRRGVVPTDAGSRLAAHAERIFAEVRVAEEDLASLTGERLSRLRVASFPSGGAALMPLAVARFRRLHPDVSLTLVEGEPEQIAPRLQAGELDLALLFDFEADPGGPAAERASPGLRQVALLDDPMDLALPSHHALAKRRTLTLRDLAGQPWVQASATSPCARHVVRTCIAAGFAPQVAFESDDYDTVQGLVAAGVGVALIPRLALDRAHPGVTVRALTPASPTRRVTVATPAGGVLSPAARSMIQVLREVAQRHLGRADDAAMVLASAG